MRPTPPPLLTVRAALVLLLAVTVGLLVTVLAYLDHQSLAAASLVGVSVAGGALLLFHAVIGK